MSPKKKTRKGKAVALPSTGTKKKGGKKIRTKAKSKSRGKATSMHPDSLGDPLDPRSFAGDFSVVEDVRDNLDIYREMTSRAKGNDHDVQKFNVSSCPATVLDSINQLRAKVWPEGDAAPLYPVALAVLQYGREVLAEHEVVQALREAQKALNRTEFDTQHRRRCVYAAADLAYDDAVATESKKRWTLTLPRTTVEDFEALAGALAINVQASMVLAMMTTLAVQEEELEGARDTYGRTVASFLERASVRAWIITSLVEGMDH